MPSNGELNEKFHYRACDVYHNNRAVGDNSGYWVRVNQRFGEKPVFRAENFIGNDHFACVCRSDRDYSVTCVVSFIWERIIWLREGQCA